MEGKIAAPTKDYDPSSLQALNNFQVEVYNAVFGDQANYRKLLYRCLHSELRADQTIRILLVCREFERANNIIPQLIVHQNGAQLIQSQNNKTLSLRSARVAVLFGVVYYLGAGIPQNDELAQRYFNLAIEMRFSDAFVFAGIMARKGHAQPSGKPNFSYARQRFQQAMADDNMEAFLQFADMVLKGEYVDDHFNTKNVNGFGKIYQILKKGCELSAKAGIEFDCRSKIYLESSLAAMEALQDSPPEITTLHEHFNKTCNARRVVLFKALLKRIAYNENGAREEMLLSGDPLGLYFLVRFHLQTIKRRASRQKPESHILEEAAQILQRVYLNLIRLRQEENALTNKEIFDKLLADQSQNDSLTESLLYHYGLSINPALLENLSEQRGCGNVLYYHLLNDQVSSQREKMRWVLKITGGQVQEDLFAGMEKHYEALYCLGELAILAADDCLSLACYIDPCYQEELAAEVRACWAFVDAVKREFQRPIQIEEEENSEEIEEETVDKDKALRENFSKKFDKFFEGKLDKRFRLMAKSGYGGLSMALRYLIGSPVGSKTLVLPKDPKVALCLVTLLVDKDLRVLFHRQSDFAYKRDKFLLLIILLDPAPVALRCHIPSEGAADLSPDSFVDDTAIANIRKCQKIDPSFFNKALIDLQNIADFYRLLEQACAPETLGVIVEKDNSHDNEAIRALFELFKKNRIFTAVVEQAISVFQSYEYQPSTLNFMSATYGQNKAYEDQLSAAKRLLQRCDAKIFSVRDLAQEILTFSEESGTDGFKLSFLTILMKIIASGEPTALLPSRCFNLAGAQQRYEKAEVLSRFCKAFESYFLQSDINCTQEYTF